MWAVLVSAIAATAIGALWYSPLLFGKTWMRLMNITPEMIVEAKAKKTSMVPQYITTFVAALVSSFILTKLISWFCNGSMTSAMKLVGVIWLGFVAAFMIHSVIWEKKPWALYFINVFYYLVTMIVTAIIVISWN
jgi:hypothetical protein